MTVVVVPPRVVPEFVTAGKPILGVLVTETIVLV
jgi:hypothetical protein